MLRAKRRTVVRPPLIPPLVVLGTAALISLAAGPLAALALFFVPIPGLEGDAKAALAIAAWMAIWWIAGDFDAYAYSMLLVNIPFNLYPIMLQRWNRGRLLRMLRRRQLPASV